MTRKRSKNKKIYSELPIFHYKSKILEKIKTNQVVIITGQTGCGKSTQVPKYLYESGISKNGVIACLHPRCVAAIALAKRVSFEMQREEGSLVGYRVRFYKNALPETKILFMTTGLMLQTLKFDEPIEKYSVIIIDEAHERSVQTDVMMGRMKEILKINQFIKLVIMSATLNVDQIQEFYGNCAVVPISNVTDKVTVIYRPLKSENYISAIKLVVEEILKSSKKGHILIFLQSEEKVFKCINSLKSLKKVKKIPFFASMDYEDKMRVFESNDYRRKVIVATNVAETSLTIDGVDFVIDSGMVKRVHYDHETSVEMWMTRPVSVAEADQRKGRTGRTGTGTCYRMYEEKCVKRNEEMEELALIADMGDLNIREKPNLDACIFPQKKKSKSKFQPFQEYPDPEIAVANLGTMVVTLKSMDVHNILKFPFVVAPDEKNVNNAVKLLKDLSILQDDGNLTKIGTQVSHLPLDPRLGKVAVMGAQFACRREVNTIIAMLSVRNVLKAPSKNQARHQNFASPHGDLFMLYNIFQEAQRNRFNKAWCKEFSINYSCIKYASLVFKQLEWILCNMPTDPHFYPKHSEENLVKKVFLSGFFSNVVRKCDTGQYLIADDRPVAIHKLSCLKNDEDIVLFLTLQKPGEGNQILMRNCTTLNDQMVKNLKPQTYKIKAPLWKDVIEKRLKL